LAQPDPPGCGELSPVQGCLIAKAGGLRITGQDIDRPRSPSGLVVETGLRFSLIQNLGRYLFLAARVEGLVNLTRWRVTLDQAEVWTAPWLAATLGLDVGVRFPAGSRTVQPHDPATEGRP
jgi:hypothetical protein